jgi:cell division protein FtsQ
MSRRDAAPQKKRGLLALLWAVRRLVLPIGGAAVVAALAIWGFLRFESYLLHSPSFAIHTRPELPGDAVDVRVLGASGEQARQIKALFHADHGRSLYSLPLAQRRAELLQLSWVRNASVSRYWPRSVEVRVDERQPLAFAHLPPARARGPARVMLIDDEGVLLEPRGDVMQDLPVLAGIRQDQSRAERALRVRKMRYLLNEVGNLGREVSVIDALEPDNLKITMRVEDKLLVLILGPDGYARRLTRFLRHYPEIRGRVLAGAVIDLRIEDRATVVKEGRQESTDAR